MYVVNAHADYTDEEAADIVAFVEGGGGVLIAGQAWFWKQTNELRSFAEYSSNKYAVYY